MPKTESFWKSWFWNVTGIIISPCGTKIVDPCFVHNFGSCLHSNRGSLHSVCSELVESPVVRIWRHLRHRGGRNGGDECWSIRSLLQVSHSVSESYSGKNVARVVYWVNTSIAAKMLQRYASNRAIMQFCRAQSNGPWAHYYPWSPYQLHSVPV